MFRFLEFIALISLPCLFTVALASLDIVIKIEHHQLSCVSITSLALFCYQDEWTYSSINLANFCFPFLSVITFPFRLLNYPLAVNDHAVTMGMSHVRCSVANQIRPVHELCLHTYTCTCTQVDQLFYWEELGHVKLSTPPRDRFLTSLERARGSWPLGLPLVLYCAKNSDVSS